MKARELAALLMQNPDKEVAFAPDVMHLGDNGLPLLQFPVEERPVHIAIFWSKEDALDAEPLVVELTARGHGRPCPYY